MESTQCYILIQTFKLEWKWHSASCNTHPAVGYFSWTTSGLVIHLGQGVIHNMHPFSVTAQQVFSVSFTTANHILLEIVAGALLLPISHFAQMPPDVEKHLISL